MSPHRVERFLPLMMRGVLVLLAAVMFFELALGEWLTALLLLVQIFLTWMVDRARAVGFRLGWVRGRLAVWLSMAEASQRGMSPMEWMLAEMERDGATVTIERVDPEEG